MSDYVLWWQNLPSQMNPVIFSAGSFAIRWYGMMYIVAFAIVYLLTRYRLDSEKLPFERSFIGDALTWVMVGVIAGGRLGYILFYGLSDFLADPLGSILPWVSAPGGCRFAGITGMSYHGAVIGVILAVYLIKTVFLKHLIFLFHPYPLVTPLAALATSSTVNFMEE